MKTQIVIWKNLILFIPLFLLLNCSCEKEFSSQWIYGSPENINDGIEVSTLEEVHLDANLIAQAIGRIKNGKYGEVHSMLIYKDEKLVLEEYFPGHRYKWDAPNHHGEWIFWDKSTLHGVKSASKSITSLCIGIAIEHGFIESAHQSIFDFLPDHQHLKKDGKGNISIEHLLTMTSGLEWDEWSAPLSSGDNDCVGIWYQEKDPVTFILERSLINEPGSSFTYSGGNMIVLGEIIRNASNLDIEEFSQEYLFKPLAIDSSFWAIRFNNGVIEAGGSLEITPRDMIKIGATCLANGEWNGKQMISTQWIEKIATEFQDNQGINIPGVASGKQGYSYSWWTKDYNHNGDNYNMFDAGGWGGQNIMVIPDLKTVVVFTGGNYTSTAKPHEILDRFIIPAIQ
jgi:CubicO group peptidase (beta-lactamase class C family)